MAADSRTAFSLVVFLSAALQRVMEVTDWIWTLAAKEWVARTRGIEALRPVVPVSEDDKVATAKSRIVLIVSSILGTAISYGLPEVNSLKGFSFFMHPLYGLMISAGTEGTNSVVKLLQAAKDLKRNEVKLSRTA